jgi:hypothetical protein
MEAQMRVSMLGLCVAATTLLAATGCFRGVRNQLITAPANPQDLYTCAQLELGRAGYAIVGADRASGWLHAQRSGAGLLGDKVAEIYATVIPNPEGTGSHLQLTDNPHADDDADRLVAACVR